MQGNTLIYMERLRHSFKKVWDDQTRFSEEEKAQYFIGYLAKFPKSKESTEEQTESQNENLENV